MSANKISYLDPFVLARIGNLQLRAKTVVEGFISGLHQSPYRGHSLEFAQHREYAIGDEPRHIDWKVYGRTDRFFVKQFEQETNLRLYVLLDSSGSMNYQGEKSAFPKYDYGAILTASIAYLTLQQGDSAGIGYTENKQVKIIPPRNSLSHLSVILEALDSIKPQGEHVCSQMLETVAHFSKKRSLVILISDLLEDKNILFNALKFLKFKKHEVVVVHLLDRDEKDFPYTGSVQFNSLENQDRLVLDTESFRNDYKTEVNGFIEEVRMTLRNAGIDYYFHVTDEPPDQFLRNFLNQRS